MITKKIPFIFDFETRSALDLTEVGAVKYCLHPSTGVTYISYCFSEHDRMKEWSPFLGTPVPAELVDVANNPDKYLLIAHNVEFDYLVYSQVWRKLFVSFMRPSISSVHDNMSVSNYFRLGSSLEANAGMLNIPLRKHEEGRKVMKLLMRPDKGGRFPVPTPQQYKDFAMYGKGDTEMLRQAHFRMPHLPAFERWVWEWTFKTNLTGVRVDVPLIKLLKSIVDQNRPAKEQRFMQITGCGVNSHVKVKAFFKQYYPFIEDMRKETVEELLLDETPVPSYVREALDIKFLIGSTAISKIEKALDIVVGDRIYGLFDYAKAQTKRFAGKGIQPQNFPRFDTDRLDNLDHIDFNVEDLVSVVAPMIPTLKDPIGFAKNLLRRIWLPEPGKEFLSGDFSKIEPTMLFWLLDMGPIPDRWYEELAADLYGIPLDQIGKDSEERQVGKAGQLSCGYGAGDKSFRVKTLNDTGILLTEEMAKKVIFTYRNKYPQVVQFWSDLEDAFGAAINGRVTKLCRGRITVMPMAHPWRGVMIVLPNGSKLYYHGATQQMVKSTRTFYTIEEGRKVKKVEESRKLAYTYLEVDSKGNTRPKTVYGGLLCENVVSATGREVMTPAMWRLEQAGFTVCGTVHDELWGIAEPGRAKEFEHIMSIVPDWCHDAVIKTEVKGGVRYLK